MLLVLFAISVSLSMLTTEIQLEVHSKIRAECTTIVDNNNNGYQAALPAFASPYKNLPAASVRVKCQSQPNNPCRPDPDLGFAVTYF